MILKGAATCATLSNVTFKSLGAYVWEDADATIRDCSFHGGLHGVYAWGKCKVEVASCKISGTEKSGVCIREGCALVMTVRGPLPASRVLLYFLPASPLLRGSVV